jgi:hypothetical protein
MHPRAFLRAALALGVTLAVTTPGTAATAEAAGPPAGRASDVGAARASVDLAIEVAEDGHGPFTPEDGPGGDASATNGVVRTFDAITYRVTMSSNDGTSRNERFTLTAPPGTAWAGLPAPCTGAGSAITGQELVCGLGDLAEGHAVAVPAVLDVSGDLRNGDGVAVTATGTADDAANGTVTANSPTTTVSAAARYNLSKNVNGSKLTTDVAGPDGTTKGIQLVFPLTVDWDPVVPGQGLLGFEHSAGPMTFADDLSEMLGDLPSDAVLWNGGHPACGVNAANDWRFSNLPGGRGGTANSVTDSGTITCEQDTAGGPVSVTITDTVTDPTHLPTTGLTGALTQPHRAYFVSGYLSVWMPTPAPGTSVHSVNVYTPLQTTSISGAPNYPGASEPTRDNRATRNIVELAPGGGYKHLYRVNGQGSSVSVGSAREGDPWVTPGTSLRSDVGAWNNGIRPSEDVVLCDTFDRATQRLTRLGDGRVASWTAGLTGGRVQYAAYDMTSPEEGQRQATCDDSDGPWYDEPEDVPGGLSAVGAIRATGGIPGGATAALYSYVVTKDAPDGTRALDFGHLRFGTDEDWIHDVSSDASLGAGGLSDSVLITENLARVQKKIVDVGHDAADTPDETSFAVAGQTLDYALYPSLTNGYTTGKTSEVTVQDVLPLHTRYLPDSASATPEIDTVEDHEGHPLQRLTWRLEHVRPNAALTPITYTARVSEAAAAEPITNEVVVASPSDKSDERYRRAQRAVQIVATGGVGVEKTAIEPVVIAGDELEWDLSYSNTDASAIQDVDLIDVLPHPGDTANSSFHGSTALARPVSADVDAGETVTYTAADPGDVSPDAEDPSNRPGGSTTWCPETHFGTAGCPDALADVTAVRIERSAPVAVGESVSHRVALTTDGEHDGDRYTNRFGLRASNLALPVQSNPASVHVVAGAVGDHVWTDENANGIQDAGEPGIADVPVHLTGADDHGAEVVRSTTTDSDGDYRFEGLRPGTYTVTFTAPDGRSFTRELAGTDRAEDSDATRDGITAATTLARVTTPGGALDGVDRIDTVDAGILPEHDAADQSEGSGLSGASRGPRPDPSSRPNSATKAAAGALAFTGSDGLPLALTGALVLLGTGAVLTAMRRARRR